MSGWSWNPLIFPNVDSLAIAHSPSSSFSNNLKAIGDAPPSMARVATQLCIQNIIIGKAFGFIDPGHQGIWI